jgi:hypothetical protein
MFTQISRSALCIAIVLSCVACKKADTDAAKKTDGSESFVFKPDAASAGVAASVPQTPASADDGSGSFHFDPKKAAMGSDNASGSK